MDIVTPRYSVVCDASYTSIRGGTRIEDFRHHRCGAPQEKTLGDQNLEVEPIGVTFYDPLRMRAGV